MLPLHQRKTHPVPVDGCFGCKVATVTVGGAPQVREIDTREKRLRQDLDMYKSLRQSGIQPAHLTGVADVAKTARNAMEIEHPQLQRLDPEARRHAPEAMQVAREIPDLLKAAKDQA